jgi:hypothetical protein
MIGVLRQGQRPGAQTALHEGMVLIAFHFYQLSVPDMQLNTTASVTSGTSGPCPGFYNPGLIDWFHIISPISPLFYAPPIMIEGLAFAFI